MYIVTISLKEFKGMKPKKRNAKHEESLSLKVCNYLKTDYPDIIFTCESSGIRLPIYAAVKLAKQRSESGLPDLMVFHPNKNYGALFIELKKEGTVIFLKNGSMTADKHIREQAAVLKRLNDLGYKACFAVGYEEAIQIIDDYMTNRI